MIGEGFTGSAETDALDHFLVGDAEGCGAIFSGVKEGEHDWWKESI